MSSPAPFEPGYVPDAATLAQARRMRDELTRFLMEYQFAVKEVLTKVTILREEFLQLHRYNPIEHVTSRIKKPESIVKKVARRGIAPELPLIREAITDIAGIRITCSFIADTYRIWTPSPRRTTSASSCRRPANERSAGAPRRSSRTRWNASSVCDPWRCCPTCAMRWTPRCCAEPCSRALMAHRTSPQCAISRASWAPTWHRMRRVVVAHGGAARLEASPHRSKGFPMTRLYCPVTADGVAALATSALTVEAAFAVTDDVRALAPHGDEELHEHIATQLAAAGCAGRRVVVVVVDVPDARVRPAASTGGGAVSGSGCWARYAFTQYPSELSLISSSRATCAIGRRPCTTNWTASALNSGVNVLRFVDMIPCRAFLVTTVYEKCHTPNERC